MIEKNKIPVEKINGVELRVPIEKLREQFDLCKSQYAKEHSTTPDTQKGVTENTGNQGTPIKTVADLDKLLDSLK